MIIKYELKEDSTDSTTPCPHGRVYGLMEDSIKVGSVNCQHCEDCYGWDTIKQTIMCFMERSK